MTFPMIFWTIVAILALFGLIRLAVRQPVKRRPESLRSMIVEHVAADMASMPVTGDASKIERKPDYRYRSAITGKFVKASYAKRYPHRTVRSKVKS